MMNERGKSDPAVVAAKLANKAERSAAEPVEPRAGTKGNANQQHPGRTQRRETVSQVLARIRQTARTAICRHSLEVGAVCRKAARTDLCGGRGAISVPTATDLHGAEGRRLVGVHPSWRRRVATATRDPKRRVTKNCAKPAKIVTARFGHRLARGSPIALYADCCCAVIRLSDSFS